MGANDRHALDAIAEHFTGYAKATRPTSPLYGAVLDGCARDPEMLALATAARSGQPAALLLLASVHYLLAGGERHSPLARYYPSVSGLCHLYPVFHRFCLAHRERIVALLSSRRVQTNEVGRCACLLPAFALAAGVAPGRPLALIEVGASARLNLYWDRYRYEYGDGKVRGDAASPVRMICALRGSGLPHLPRRFPTVASHVGLELHPIDVRDPDERLWLRALVWPENLERAATLRQALELARSDPPPLIAGDALDLLPDVLAALPSDSLACVVHTHTVYQFSPAECEQLRDILAAHDREVVKIRLEPVPKDTHSALELLVIRNGAWKEQRLAGCDYHGRWLDWSPVEMTPDSHLAARDASWLDLGRVALCRAARSGSQTRPLSTREDIQSEQSRSTVENWFAADPAAPGTAVGLGRLVVGQLVLYHAGHAPPNGTAAGSGAQRFARPSTRTKNAS